MFQERCCRSLLPWESSSISFQPYFPRHEEDKGTKPFPWNPFAYWPCCGTILPTALIHPAWSGTQSSIPLVPPTLSSSIYIWFISSVKTRGMTAQLLLQDGKSSGSRHHGLKHFYLKSRPQQLKFWSSVDALRNDLCESYKETRHIFSKDSYVLICAESSGVPHMALASICFSF